MSRFENKVAQMSNYDLVKLQDELKERVESGKLSFGRKALNLLGAVALGETLGVLSAFGYDRLSKKNAIAVPIPGMVAGTAVPALFSKSRREELASKPHVKKLTIIGGAVSIGTLIAGSLIFNAQSRKKDARRLSFVQQEMERREAAENEQQAPQVG